MKYIACKQGEPLWYEARAGKVTASKFADAISVLQRKSGDKGPGDPTDASDKYAAEVAIERISKLPWGEPIKPWVLQRGNNLEPQARLAYETRTGNLAEEAGVVTDDEGRFGYSTDGMVNANRVIVDGTEVLIGCEGLIEIKCPVDGLKILSIWRHGDISEYFEQMQGGMWLTGAQWCDFIMFVPELANSGRDLYTQRVMRDETFIRDMVAKLEAFNERANRYLLALGGTLTH